MALLKKLEKVVGGSILSAPHRLMLRTALPVRLCVNNEPSLGHVYPLPALHWHIQQLEQHSEVRKEAWLHKWINHDLSYLRASLQAHLSNAIRYIQSGAELTPQAIADIYAVKKQIRATDEWYEKFVNPALLEKLPYFSNENIYSILHSLKDSKSPVTERLLEELGRRSLEEYDLVDYDNHESVTYRFATSCNEPNALLNACSGHHNQLKFRLNTVCSNIWDMIETALYRSDSSNNNFRLSPIKRPNRDDIKKLLGEFHWNSKAQTLLEKL